MNNPLDPSLLERERVIALPSRERLPYITTVASL